MEFAAAARTDESLSESASLSASMVAESLSAPSSKAADARPGTPELAKILCMEAIPSPSPGTGTKPTPCCKANRNVIRGVCIVYPPDNHEKATTMLTKQAATLTSPPSPGGALILWGRLQCGLESAHDLSESDADGVANFLEFKQVQPPRPRLVLAYEGLVAAERIGYIGLVQSLLFPYGTE
jgi:hypothetical protein